MKPFTYHYHETTHNAVAESFMEDANQRYQITLDNGECLVIAAAGWLTPDGRTVWIQSEKPDEITYPHEMVQAIGEGMKMDEKLSSKQNVSIENNVNSHGLKRTIPDPIKREVRQKYGFGCVVCGLGIFQYDHFNPEFKDATEHSPVGIILLCPRCHHKKTTHALSQESIEEHLKNPAALVSGYSKEILDVGKGDPTFIFAGSTFKRTAIPIRLNGIDLFFIGPPETEGGPFSFNARFFDSKGENTLNVINNEWMARSENWDVEIIGGVLTIREGQGKTHMVLRNTEHNIIEVERIVTILGNKKIVGNKEKLQLFNAATNELISTFSGLQFDSWTVGVSL